ncbi:hypothetical protein I7I50_10735 [Histoplasma capsulatum G186AR]|nr:hypothetical protein I7I50_10735 [Histoplasma capsulatum G186AR]
MNKPTNRQTDKPDKTNKPEIDRISGRLETFCAQSLSTNDEHAYSPKNTEYGDPRLAQGQSAIKTWWLGRHPSRRTLRSSVSCSSSFLCMFVGCFPFFSFSFLLLFVFFFFSFLFFFFFNNGVCLSQPAAHLPRPSQFSTLILTTIETNHNNQPAGPSNTENQRSVAECLPDRLITEIHAALGSRAKVSR